MIREAIDATRSEVVDIIAPIVAARREQPQDDLISVLVEAEITDEDGVDAPAVRRGDLLVRAAAARAPARARRGSRWASPWPRCSQRPEVLDAVRDDRQLLRPAIEESLRWMPTDPMFSRWVTRRHRASAACTCPTGAVMHLCIGAANRDPARWERPDEYDITRPPKPSLAFGGARTSASACTSPARR